MHPRALLPLLLLTLLFTIACGGSDQASTEAADPAASDTPPAAETAPAEEPSGDAAQSSAPAPVTSRTPAAGDTINAPGATFTLPESWQTETPSSSMRLAQAAIPGDAGEGQLTVFYFGPGGGGGVDANIDRWIGQMEIAPGSQPTRETFDVGNFRVTWVDVEGTIKPSTMGVGPSEAQPGSRMLGAVVEGAQGPWFFKATGPTATLDAERDAFLFMLRSASAS